MQIHGRRFDTGQPVVLEIAGERITQIRPADVADDRVAGWPWIAPGLWDLQINGYGGQEFSSPRLTPEHVAQIAGRMASFGVVKFCPTVTTESFNVLVHALKTIAATCESSARLSRQIPGIHLEGPYLSPDDGPRGAHPKAHCRRPDWDEFRRLQDSAGGRIRLLTMAVEFDEAPEFISRAADSGVTVAIGHTAANSEQIRRAVDAGARLSTHLGNGCHRTLPRHPNYLWDQLADDRLTASLIVDGHHLPREVVQTFVRAKTPERCALVSDLSGYAGLPPGRYATGLCDLEILDDGRLVVAGQRQLLAGASWPLSAGVARVMDYAGVSLGQAIRMASSQAAEVIGCRSGRLEVGQPADVIQFEWDTANSSLAIKSTSIAGESV